MSENKCVSLPNICCSQRGKQTYKCTSVVVCGAEIFLNISVSTALDPGGRESLANTVGWCGWEVEGRIHSGKSSTGPLRE